MDGTGNATTEAGGEGPAGWVPLDTFVGLVLALSSCLFIGVSVILKKLALRDLEGGGGTRAVDGGFGYLRLPKWWLGISLMGLGELANFGAYAFAPAVLVTPLGAFSVVCTAALSPRLLGERLGAEGRLGCVLVLAGCAVVTLCGPKEGEVAGLDDLRAQLLRPAFLAYAGAVVGASVAAAALLPRFRRRRRGKAGLPLLLLYVSVCSSFGSLSVMFCKGVGLALKEAFAGGAPFRDWASWVCLAALASCLAVETVYMQRALDLFNGSVFMSVNYVLFTSLVIVASSILYTELSVVGAKDIVLMLLGFVVNVVALFLLHLDREDKPPAGGADEGGGRNAPKASSSSSSSSSSPPLPPPVPPLQVGGKAPPGEQGTPLLGRPPSSPLSGLNTLIAFPDKTNSCVSLISSHALDHALDDDDGGADGGGRIRRCASARGHCRSSSSSSSSSGCMCEVPLLNELRSSTSKLGLTTTTTTNCRSSSRSPGSKKGEVNVPVDDDDDGDDDDEKSGLGGHTNALV